jgi:hypothetical protein
MCWPDRARLVAACVLLLLGCADRQARQLGDLCARDDECASGRCDETVCKAKDPLDLGAACSHNLQCRSERCEQAQCIQGSRATGMPCSDDLQCHSSHCVGEICVALANDAAVDDSGSLFDLSRDAPAAGDAGPGDLSVDGPAGPDDIWIFGSPSSDGVSGLVFDSSGNLFFAGGFYETVDFGGGGLTSAGDRDIFFSSRDPAGQHRWSRRLGDAQRNGVSRVVLDPAGDLYLAGSFSGTLDLGGGALTSAGESDIYLARFDPTSGAHRWSMRLGGSGGEGVADLALDGAGHLFVAAGSSGDTLDLGGGPMPGFGAGDIVLVKLTTDGAHLASRRFGSEAHDDFQALAVDPSGNLFVTGSIGSVTDLGGGQLPYGGYGDIFLACYATGDLAHRWSKTFGGYWRDDVEALLLDAAGNVTITGSFSSDTIDFGGPGQLANPSGYPAVEIHAVTSDLFLASFDAGGRHRWSQRFGDTGGESGHDLVGDAAGNLYLTGSFGGKLDLGGGELTGAGYGDIFVASFDASGAHRWSRRYGGIRADAGRYVGLSPGDEVYVAGTFTHRMEIDGFWLDSIGGTDIFLLRFVP